MRETAGEPLIASYRGLICDLDGVVYRGPDAVPGAADALNRITADGVAVVFATNNASRTPGDVAAHLRELGVGPDGWSVVTSSQAAAAYLATHFPARTPVLAVGGPGVAEALIEAGLAAVRVSESNGTPVEAVLQGLGVDVTWRELAEVGYRVQQGATWVATNLDPMLPTARGPAPGNGALVAAVQQATTARPHVVGKPGSALFELARVRLGTQPSATLVCGDRLDTDIEGANASGLDSVFVLSGACGLRDLAFASSHARPTYVARDLTGLLSPSLRIRDSQADQVDVKSAGALCILGATSDASLPAVVATAWAALDAGRVISSDAEMWQGLERQLQLRKG